MNPGDSLGFVGVCFVCLDLVLVLAVGQGEQVPFEGSCPNFWPGQLLCGLAFSFKVLPGMPPF